MRKSRVLLVGVAVAAAAAATSAFTASNTFSRTDNTAGYGTNSVSGATITNIAYTPDATDASKLAEVVFTASNDFTGSASSTGATMVLSLDGTPGPATGSANTCAVDPATDVITCTLTASMPFTAFDNLALTVVSQ